MHVVATAGHVDHGKSTLVRALTGMEPDRWAEERRRGLTIDLGFAWTRLPSGRTVALVDVPGHERFIVNTLAGLGPVTAAMFVVAADEGWMPQSAEHLEALGALGVRHGLLAVTRSDLADPAPALARARAELAAAGLAQAEAIAVSGATGDGLPELRAALDRLTAALPAPDTAAPVRLWVDRSFTVKGAGTVVTGTLGGGTLRVGDALHAVPSGAEVRVRGLQSLKETLDTVPATARVAVNLRGAELSGLRRGTALLTPGGWLPTTQVDVRLFPPPGEVRPVGERLMLHLGSAAVGVRVRLLGAGTARLTLNRALPLRIGDRALLRDPGRRQVVAGVQALDVAPPPTARRGGAAARATVLAALDGVPDGAGELERRGLVRAADLAAMGCVPPEAPMFAGWMLSPEYRDTLRDRLVGLIRGYAVERPLEPGLPQDVAVQALGLPDRRLLGALGLSAMGVRLSDGRLSIGDGAPGLPDGVRAAVDELRDELAERPFFAPEKERLAALGLTARELAAAVRAGALLRLAEGVYLLPDAVERATPILAELDQPFTVAQARTALATTRRVAVPLLELLGRRGVTVRDGDHHRVRHGAVPAPRPG
ncbi:MAG: selenocysteine-specific translation elongation factor [Streptosporangiales bacterium]|nr:selenocysteine-specific translation elongation factor [Streptosporangiales bacterium]